MNAQLTDKEQIALDALREHQEGISHSNAQGDWASIYLDNAKPVGWTGKQWAGVLSSLAQKGLYQEDDGYAFGLVLMS